MSNISYKDVVIKKQILLIEKGIKKFKSQSLFADIAGMTKQQIHRYLCGDNEIRWSMYLKLKDIIENTKAPKV